ncbi:hypothetical protein HDU99_009177, partial [Rhizoclosmatium hyalinum]
MADAGMFSFFSTPYSQGLFGCFGDCQALCGVCCCQCIWLGLASGKINKDGAFDLVSCCCPAIGAYRLRRKVQSLFGIQESEEASICAVSLPCISQLALIQ